MIVALRANREALPQSCLAKPGVAYLLYFKFLLQAEAAAEVRQRHMDELRTQIAANEESRKHEHEEQVQAGIAARAKIAREMALIEVGSTLCPCSPVYGNVCSENWLLLPAHSSCRSVHMRPQGSPVSQMRLSGHPSRCSDAS